MVDHSATKNNPPVFIRTLTNWAHSLHACEYEEDTRAVEYLTNMSREIIPGTGL